MLKSGLKQRNSFDLQEMCAWGREWGQQLQGGALITFEGSLGAGKTTLIKAIVEGIYPWHKELVSSPTFSYLHIYGEEELCPVFHFDLYRLKDERAFLERGFEEYLERGGITLIEWSHKISSLLKHYPHTCVEMAHVSEELREITTWVN